MAHTLRRGASVVVEGRGGHGASSGSTSSGVHVSDASPATAARADYGSNFLLLLVSNLLPFIFRRVGYRSCGSVCWNAR